MSRFTELYRPAQLPRVVVIEGLFGEIWNQLASCNDHPPSQRERVRRFFEERLPQDPSHHHQILDCPCKIICGEDFTPIDVVWLDRA